MIGRVEIKEAVKEDYRFIVRLMTDALNPYYGGDHKAHAKRIFETHISGGVDQVGHFSFEQKMFVISFNGEQAGMVNIVGKRQGTYKISPIIIDRNYRNNYGLGSALLDFIENYARKNKARQIYCTVAKQNQTALNFFNKKGYITAGLSASHYKLGITEVMMYKPFYGLGFEDYFDKPNISVVPMLEKHETQVRRIILENFQGFVC